MSLVQLKPIDLPAIAEPTSSERFTRTLVELTRAVWHPQCTFETAISEICAAAAAALQVERVSVWQHEVGQPKWIVTSRPSSSSWRASASRTPRT